MVLSSEIINLQNQTTAMQAQQTKKTGSEQEYGQDMFLKLMLEQLKYQDCLWHSNAKTKGYGQNIAHSLVHIIIERKANTLKRVHYSLGFPIKSKCAFYTLYSAQCFIGMDCTELIFFLRWSVKWKFISCSPLEIYFYIE